MKNPVCTTDENGTIEYRVNDLFHRTDGPARICPDRGETWFQHGLCHRVDGPAYIEPSGYQEWCQNGEFHRTDGPAMIYPDGTEEYWLNGKKVDIMVHFILRKSSE